MHDFLDRIFSKVWRALPDQTPVMIDYGLARLEYFIHRFVNLFEKNDKWER